MIYETLTLHSDTALPGTFPVDPLAMCPECGKRWHIEHIPALMDAENRDMATLFCDPKWEGCGKPFYIRREPR